MKNNKMIGNFIVLAVIITVGFGCKYLKLNKSGETTEEPKTTEELRKTEITKDILTERLVAKGVKVTAETPNRKSNPPTLPEDLKKVEIREDDATSGKPNPLMLQLRFATGNNNFLLNNELQKSFGELASHLREIFKTREDNGIFIEGTNEIYKRITLSAYQKDIDDYKSKGIFVEDFEKLVDDLQNEGFDQIEIDVNENNLPPVKDVRKSRVKVSE